jgi:regulator of protease activity HflC (stomatin/prohibitin superfamily)
MIGPLTTVGLFLLAFIASGIKILREYQRAVVFRLGRLVAARGPGLVYVIPMIERMVRVDLRTVTMEIPPQDVITRDNVSVKVSAVLYFRVVDPSRAVVQVENFLYATLQLAQTTLRSTCGQADLDELLAERERLNARIQEIVDAQSEPWGVKVVMVEVKHIDLPQEMQRAIARQAEAERERRAKVINAEGEYQAAQRMMEAAQVIEPHPVALQLRYLQTLGSMAVGNPSTTIFPIPIDLFGPFFREDKRETEDETKLSPSPKEEGPT